MEAPASVAEIRERNPDAFAAFERAREKDPSLSPHLIVHKPWIDGVTWTRPGEPGVYRRVPEVIDAGSTRAPCRSRSGATRSARLASPRKRGEVRV